MDLLQRGMDREQSLRVVAATTTELVQEACDRHELRGAEAIVLGRALTAGCLMATLTKKDDERVRIDMRGGGPIGTILVDSHGDGSVRGCLSKKLDELTDAPLVDGRRSVTTLVGTAGNVVVTRDVGLEDQYQGTVPMRAGEVDLDLEHYLNNSEQLPSAMVCEVVLGAGRHVLRSGGVLCQSFPGEPSERLAAIRDNFRTGVLVDLLRHERTTEDLMGFALLGAEFDAVAETPLRYACTCGPRRALSVVSTLGADELESMADEPGDTEVRCSFCGASYALRPEELRELATRLRQERS